jgi:hypothetical protein
VASQILQANHHGQISADLMLKYALLAGLGGKT